MTTPSERCPKCDGEMVQGFLIDLGHANSARVSRWAEGAPQKSFWTGTRTPADAVLPVGTFRCSTCGFLESYAKPEFAAS
jgi:hypothetical protein